ncbi:MAG TPA: hypothetical protein VMR44_05815 [Thermoanaerobaculia bacterium]|nr:hypothetical protein [Thermoanaerobaculia bacterium]
MNRNGPRRVRYSIEVEAVTVPPWRAIPANERLRRFLKAALRSYGWRVTAVRPVRDQREQVVFRAVEDGAPPIVDVTLRRGPS